MHGYHRNSRLVWGNPVDPTTPSPHLGSAHGTARAPSWLSRDAIERWDRIGPAMKRAVLAIALTAGFLVGGAIAQTSPDDKEPIPPRSIQLTAEQDHVRDRAKGHAYRASAPQHRDQDWRESTTRYRIADLSTTRGREGTASQNIQILSHRESDRGRISAEHNCGHYQVVLIRAGTLPWSTGDALFPGCGNKARLKIGPYREDAAQSRKFRRRVSGNLGIETAFAIKPQTATLCI